MKRETWLVVITWALDSHPSPPPWQFSLLCGITRIFLPKDCIYNHNFSVTGYLRSPLRSVAGARKRVCFAYSFDPNHHEIEWCDADWFAEEIWSNLTISQIAYLNDKLRVYFLFILRVFFTIKCGAGRRWSNPQSQRNPEATADCFRLSTMQTFRMAES